MLEICPITKVHLANARMNGGTKMSVENALAIMDNLGNISRDIEDGLVKAVRRMRASRNHRSDLQLHKAPYRDGNRFFVDVQFNKEIGLPSKKDVFGFVASVMPNREPDLKNSVKASNTILKVAIKAKDSFIRVNSYRDIPKEFIPVGTGLFKKADSAHDIWELKKTADGFELIRKIEESVTPVVEEISLKSGEAVKTPEGIGLVVSLDKRGNPMVYINGSHKIFAKDSISRWDENAEAKLMQEFYEKVYGDKEFAKMLVDTKPNRPNR